MTRLRRAKTTTTLANGTKVTRTKLVEADDLEWQIQAEAYRQIQRLPGYGDEAAPGVTFTCAADGNTGKRRGTISKATGIKAGEEDLRLYKLGGDVLLIELKAAKTLISADQHKRHALHRHLGFRVEVVRGKTIEQGAADVVALVKEWLGEPANDNWVSR